MVHRVGQYVNAGQECMPAWLLQPMFLSAFFICWTCFDCWNSHAHRERLCALQESPDGKQQKEKKKKKKKKDNDVSAGAGNVASQ